MDHLKIGAFRQLPAQPDENSNQKGSLEFDKVIKGAIDRVNSLDNDADKSIMGLLNGKGNVHETMIALQKVDISMRLLLAVRNKAIDAYKEIIHMQF